MPTEKPIRFSLHALQNLNAREIECGELEK